MEESLTWWEGKEKGEEKLCITLQATGREDATYLLRTPLATFFCLRLADEG